MDNKTANRDKTGRFIQGVSGNPSGRPKRIEELTVTCRGLTPDAMTTVQEIMTSPDARGADRIQAARLVLEYAWGKPSQQVDIDVRQQVENMSESEINAEIERLYTKMHEDDAIDISAETEE